MDQGGLQQLFAALRRDLERFLVARGLSPEDAEDLLQDLFVKIETIGPGPISEPKAYLYRMANNLAHDRRRAEERRRRRDAAWITAQAGLDESVVASWNADEILQARDYLRRIDAALEQLPERTSSIFRRFRIEGESQKAIADSLAISLSAVEKHLQRAYRVVLDVKRRLDQPCAPAPLEFEEGGQDARSP